MRPLSYSVAVFAYNEEQAITQCLDSIQQSCEGTDTIIHVLANGCTDGTERAVSRYAQTHRNIRLVVIELGDKANAWNHYVHVIAPRADVHFFVDGDVMISPGALRNMTECLHRHPEASAAAGLPISGRSRDSLREKLISNREMAGNFYALRGSTVDDFRRRDLRLPVGIFGEDGLVGMLVKCDLDPLEKSKPDRIVPCEEGGFYFDSLSILNLSHWRIYRNRKMRYAVRRQQANMLYPMLFAGGLDAMPRHVADMYGKRSDVLKLRWNGTNTYFDFVAIRRIKRKTKLGAAASALDEARYYS